jgi:hypothetical protein
MSAARATLAALPGARLETFTTGHVVFSSDPAGFLHAINPFLERVGASAGDPR